MEHSRRVQQRTNRIREREASLRQEHSKKAYEPFTGSKTTLQARLAALAQNLDKTADRRTTSAEGYWRERTILLARPWITNDQSQIRLKGQFNCPNPRQMKRKRNSVEITKKTGRRTAPAKSGVHEKSALMSQLLPCIAGTGYDGYNVHKDKA
eukprot:1150549-Pelagomonas_calceolata.AAC.2